LPQKSVTFDQENRENPDECEDGQIYTFETHRQRTTSSHTYHLWAEGAKFLLVSLAGDGKMGGRTEGPVEDVIKA
jgi:hypothetical protein